MKRLALAAALAAITLPALAAHPDNNMPGRNNPNAAAIGHDATLAPGTPGSRMGPMAGDVPGRRMPMHMARGMASGAGKASTPGGGHMAVNRAAQGWDNDNYPGNRYPGNR